MQNATPQTRGPGRPAQHDAPDVVARAMIAFWSDGYDDTSLADLEQATKVDRSTLYNSFGGKRGIYDLATAAYLNQAEVGLFAPLSRDKEDGLDGIVDFFEGLGRGLTSGTYPAGCLIVNDMAAGTAPDAARRYVELLEDGLRMSLERARSTGRNDGARTERRIKLLSTAVLGINLTGRHAQNADDVLARVSAVIAEIESWRRPRRRS